MDNDTVRRAGGSQQRLAQEIATRSADPNFFAGLAYLPNPDHVLQRLGRAQDVYDQILSDAHVLGELRSTRAGLLSYESKLLPGGDTPADARALDLCQWVIDRMPSPGMQWSDVFWNMGLAVYRGWAVHEVVWDHVDSMLLPVRILDRANTRFLFSPENELRLKTRANPTNGELLGPHKWLLSRHMPSQANPYGVALLSSCFWPWTFKTNGFRYFVKFCEKYGLPKAVGKYPEGTPPADQDALAARLSQLIEDAVAAIPADGSVEVIESRHSGELVHERLVAVCNAELSKVLTSQTLATEIRGDGSRAAAETHRGREQDVQASDRGVIESTINQLFRWVTELNVPNAKPPTFHFFEEAEARKGWLEVLDKARVFMPVPASFAHERLQIPAPVDNEPVLPSAPGPTPAVPPPGDFSRQPTAADYAAPPDEFDDLVAQMPAAVRALLDEVDSLEAFRDGLAGLFDDISDAKLGDYLTAALAAGYLEGMDEAGE